MWVHVHGRLKQQCCTHERLGRVAQCRSCPSEMEEDLEPHCSGAAQLQERQAQKRPQLVLEQAGRGPKRE